MNLPLSVANHTYIYLYVSHCLGLTRSQADTFLHCNIAPLWYRYASAVALGAAWLSFYQILALFKWMIPVLRRDQRTKSPLFLSDPLLSLFLPCPSLKAQLQSFVTPPKKRDFLFSLPRFPAGPHPAGRFGALPKEQASLWCHHISSVSNTLLFPIVLRYDVPTKGTQNGREPILYIGWISTCANVN